MKVVVTAQGNSLDALVDPRFGRAAWFLVIDTDTLAVTVIDNASNVQTAHGAGNEAGRLVAQAGAKAVITGNVGPNAFRTLSAAGVAVHTAQGPMTVRDAVAAFNRGALPQVGDATVAGWS
jgi:predicted Fe-Mo cluster-binding NifX family protein